MSKAECDGKLKAEGRCRLCLRLSSVRRLTRHRLIPGSSGGRYVPVNVVPLCRPCHDLVDHRDRELRRTARKMLRASLWPVEIAAASGWYWFDRAYERPSRELVLARRSAA